MLRCDDHPMHEVTTATNVRSDQATRHMGVCTASPSGALAQETRARSPRKVPALGESRRDDGGRYAESLAGKRLWPPTGRWGATERAVRSARTSARTSPGDAGHGLTSCCDAERECA